MPIKRTALIVAAGRGTRAGGSVPKQYRMLGQHPVLRHTINIFLRNPHIECVRVVIHAEDEAEYTHCVRDISDPRLAPAVYGGETRSASVMNGLLACDGDQVFIHDGARPLLPQDALNRIVDSLDTHRATFLALPTTDALWHIENNQATHAHPRDTLWRAQTPQAFYFADILAAHRACEHPMDDDVAAARAAGLDVHPILGAERNMKITRPEDFELAETWIGAKMDVRVGNGFDVHKFGDGDHVMLCGVKIPFDRGLIGHSDADVGLHAMTDAILGALGAGDIGRWFHPHDDQWKGAASDIFLRKAVELAHEKGFSITHIDCTLICEQPKIRPHADMMRKKISEIIDLEIDRISVKATTSEKLGFTGRSEGIAAQATATLVKS